MLEKKSIKGSYHFNFEENINSSPKHSPWCQESKLESKNEFLKKTKVLLFWSFSVFIPQKFAGNPSCVSTRCWGVNDEQDGYYPCLLQAFVTAQESKFGPIKSARVDSYWCKYGWPRHSSVLLGCTGVPDLGCTGKYQSLNKCHEVEDVSIYGNMQ